MEPGCEGQLGSAAFRWLLSLADRESRAEVAVCGVWVGVWGNST